MDTGSEFAMVMTHMAKDTFKDSVEIIKMLLNFFQKDKELRNKFLLSGLGLKELAQKALNYEGIELSKEALMRFKELADKENLKHCGMPNFEDPEKSRLFFDSADIERVNAIFDKLKDIDFERMSQEELNKGILETIEQIESMVENENDMEERQKDLEEYHQMFDSGTSTDKSSIEKSKTKTKEKEPVR